MNEKNTNYYIMKTIYSLSIRSKTTLKTSKFESLNSRRNPVIEPVNPVYLSQRTRMKTALCIKQRITKSKCSEHFTAGLWKLNIL